MTLIDYFNSFQEVSQRLGLSANARSLYFAILAEFNRLRFPQKLKLTNIYLQQVSSITSSHSFSSARNALQNAGVIRQKKGVYELLSVETLRKESGNFAERTRKDFTGLLTFPQPIKKEKEKEGEGERDVFKVVKGKAATVRTSGLATNVDDFF